MNTERELIREIPKGLLKWYHFRDGRKALCISAGTDFDGCLAEVLSECGLKVTVASVMEMNFDFIQWSGQFDYAVVAELLTASPCIGDADRLLGRIRLCMKPEGTLFVCTDNRIGLRYFCGDRDPFTGRNFDGVENYRRVKPEDQSRMEGRLYAKAELVELLERAEFCNHRFYSVFPEILHPQILIAEDYTPTEELSVRIFPQYHHPDTVFLEEENLYTTLIQNGIFHAMANGFVVECPLNGEFSNANQITVSMDRGEERALCTIIRRDNQVEKRPLYEAGRANLSRLAENHADLKRHGIPVLDGRMVQGSYLMPYVEGEPLLPYFKGLAETNREEFYRQFDRFWQLILASSEHVPYEKVDWEHIDPWWNVEEREKPGEGIDRSKWRKIVEENSGAEPFGPILKHGYFDLVFLNGFWVDGKFLFYDQELCMDNLPAKSILLRNIDFLYYCDTKMNTVLPRRELMDRYGVEEYKELYYAHGEYMMNELRHDDELWDYHRMRRRNDGIVDANRQRMNYSAEEYERIFVNIFAHAKDRRLILFGAGKYARQFLERYGEEFPVDVIVDNNEEKWGQTLEGIPIHSPQFLEELREGTYKVMVCVKYYQPILRQLDMMGIREYSVFNPKEDYLVGDKNT